MEEKSERLRSFCSGDDVLRDFYQTSVQFLTQMSRSTARMPVAAVKAQRDVERIVKIEERMLSEQDQSMVLFYLLQIARLCGENG